MMANHTGGYKVIIGHSHNHSEESVDNINVTKFICMLVLGVSSLVSGNAPLFLSRFGNSTSTNEYEIITAKRRKHKIISVLLAFTGGVLFCTIFIHLLPEVGEVFEELLEKEEYQKLPEFTPQALLCAGFFIIYFVEELAQKLMHKNVAKSSTHIPHPESVGESRQNIICNRDIHELEHMNSARTSVRSFLLALALSVHAFFEGMAIGLEKNTSSVWFMLFGVGSHKVLLSLCMGIEMVAGNIKTLTHVLYVAMFAVVSPLGMISGLIITSEQEIVSAVFQGIAGGTLLYVLFYEVLKRNSGGATNNGYCVDSGLTSFLAILLGFLVMTLLQLVAGD